MTAPVRTLRPAPPDAPRGVGNRFACSIDLVLAERLWRAGVPVGEIAVACGCSRQNIGQHAAVRRWPKRRPGKLAGMPAIDWGEVERFYRDGVPTDELCAFFRVGTDTILKRARVHGWTRRRSVGVAHLLDQTAPATVRCTACGGTYGRPLGAVAPCPLCPMTPAERRAYAATVVVPDRPDPRAAEWAA